MRNSDHTDTSLTRRALIGKVAGIGAGALAVLSREPGSVDLLAQFGGVEATPVAPDPRFPQPPTWGTELKEVAPNVFAYIQAGGPGKDNVSVSNAGFIIGDEGLMVIDALGAPFHVKAFMAAIRRVTDKPFRHLIITHHHADHIAGNQWFEGAEIVGHPYCREEMVKAAKTAQPVWAKREGWADGTEPRRVLPPVTTIESKVTYHYGRNVVEVFPMAPAHTWGDLVVRVPEHQVLFAGDIGFFYVAPFFQNAHPSNWIDVCSQINRMDLTTIVPGHGPLGGKPQLAEMQDYMVVLKREARRRFDAKMSAGAAAADIRMGKFDNWVGPERIVMDTARLYDEFAGTLKPDMNGEGIRTATEAYNAAKKAASR
jgi:cyclase